jgi:hypothetical protein
MGVSAEQPVATALALSACAASPPANGNARGRVLKWFATNANAVQAEADRHCKQYGKLARITEMRTEAAGTCCLNVPEREYTLARMLRTACAAAPQMSVLLPAPSV